MGWKRERHLGEAGPPHAGKAELRVHSSPSVLHHPLLALSIPWPTCQGKQHSAAGRRLSRSPPWWGGATTRRLEGLRSGLEAAREGQRVLGLGQAYWSSSTLTDLGVKTELQVGGQCCTILRAGLLVYNNPIKILNSNKYKNPKGMLVWSLIFLPKWLDQVHHLHLHHHQYLLSAYYESGPLLNAFYVI